MGGASQTGPATSLFPAPARRRIDSLTRITRQAWASTTRSSGWACVPVVTIERRRPVEVRADGSQLLAVDQETWPVSWSPRDPRVRLKPGRVKGRIVIPLTRQPDGMQAWKIVIPTSKVTPEPRAHDGYEWIYVLSGRMRLVLGDQDWTLGPGEVAEFDTKVPHWFGSTGDEPAEILSIFGRPGERMTVRTTTPSA